MAAVMGETYPDLYAGVGVHSGLPTGSASNVASAFAAMRGAGAVSHKTDGRSGDVPTIDFYGTADATVYPSNAERIMMDATPDAASISPQTVAAQLGRRGYTPAAELWLIDGAGHAWSGGRPGGAYVDPTAPNASAKMLRFFLSNTYSQETREDRHSLS